MSADVSVSEHKTDQHEDIFCMETLGSEQPDHIEQDEANDQSRKNDENADETISNVQMTLLCLKLLFTTMDHFSDVLVLIQLWNKGFYNFFIAGTVIDLLPGPVTAVQFWLLNYPPWKCFILLFHPINEYIHTFLLLVHKMKGERYSYHIRVVKFSSGSRGVLEAPLQLVFTTTLIAIAVLPSPFDPDEAPIFSNYHGAKLYLSFIPVLSVVMSFITIIIDASMIFNIWMNPIKNSASVVISWLLFLIPTISFRLQTWILLFTYLMEFIILIVGLILAFNLAAFALKRKDLNSNPVILSVCSLAFPVINLNYGQRRQQPTEGIFVIKILSVIGTLILLAALWGMYWIIIVNKELPYNPEIRINRRAILFLMASSSVLGIITITSPFLIMRKEPEQTCSFRWLKHFFSRASLIFLTVAVFVFGLSNLGIKSLERDVLSVTEVCYSYINKLNVEVLTNLKDGSLPETVAITNCLEGSIPNVDPKSKLLLGCYEKALIFEDKTPSSPIDNDLRGLEYILVKKGPKARELEEFYRVFCIGRNQSEINVEKAAENINHLFRNAVNFNNVYLMKKLLEKGADPNRPDPQTENTPLHYACSNGHVDVIELLLSRPNINVDARNKNGLTPLAFCGFQGFYEGVKALVDHGANISSGINVNENPLGQALQGGHVKISLFLIDKGALLRNEDKRNRLHYTAIFMNETRVAEKLISLGTDYNQRDKDGYTPFYLAAGFGNLILVQYLLNNGYGDPSVASNFGRTPLGNAAAFHHYFVVDYLLQQSKARLNQADQFGNTPLHFAAHWGLRDSARVLLEHGADTTVQNNDNFTAEQIARQDGYPEIADFIASFNRTMQEEQ